MKALILCMLVSICLPRVVGSASYYRIANGMRTIENRDGKITVTERSDRFKKIYYFIAKHPAEHNPIQTTELIYNSTHPEHFAAIASVESGFDPSAVGPDGEVTIFQILEWNGKNPLNNVEALNAAEQVLAEKKVGRSLSAAIKAYNGRGSKAERYKRLVLKRVEEINKMKI